MRTTGKWIFGAALGLISLGGLIQAQSAAAPKTAHPLKIGIIGSGRQGGNLGIIWARQGHEVFYSSRHPEELKELVSKAGPNAKAGLPDAAAKFGEVVVIAVPYGVEPQIGKDYAALMKGKVVIELGNPRADRDGPMANDALAQGAGTYISQYFPGARLVRAFNALGSAQVLSESFRAGEKLAIPVAGDDQAAVALVTQLVRDSGFDPVVVGNLASSKQFDAGTPVYVKGFTAKQMREALKLPTQ